MIAIHTKYIGASNTHGSRIKAYTTGNAFVKGFTCTLPVNHSLNDVERHFEAVKALVAKYSLDWSLDNMRHGDSSDGKGYTFCFDASKVTA
jgi:hypothetical protein